MLKLTTTEKRAESFCNRIKELGSTTIEIEWIDSKTWGSNPRIMGPNGKCTNISGCGYDKESQCLADCIRFLGSNEEDNDAIWKTGGCGFDSVAEALASIGWNLKKIHSSKKLDLYTIEKA